MSQDLKDQQVQNKLLEDKFYFTVLIIIVVIILMLLVILSFYNKYSQKKKLSEVTEEKNREVMIQKSRLEEAFDNINELNKELNELNSTKDRFFSIIAHDLKGPVGNLKQLSDILMNDLEMLDKADLKDFIEHMSNSAKGTMALLKNLLEWSRVQLGKISFEPQNVQLNMIVDQVTSLLEVSAINKSISLKSNVPKDIQVIVDVNMVNTVIRNLTSNSIKFTPENGEITINAEKKRWFCNCLCKRQWCWNQYREHQ